MATIETICDVELYHLNDRESSGCGMGENLSTVIHDFVHGDLRLSRCDGKGEYPLLRHSDVRHDQHLQLSL